MGRVERAGVTAQTETLPRIAAVSAGDTPWLLKVRWRHGGESWVDVSGPLTTFRVYARLLDDPGLFGKVRVGEHGADAIWTDELDMAADTLWRLAQEQSGSLAIYDEITARRDARPAMPMTAVDLMDEMYGEDER